MSNKSSLKPKKVTRWALKEIEITDTQSIQSTLDQGYEPFAVMTRFVPAPVSVIDPQPGRVAPVNLMYFKIKYDIPVDEQGREKVISLVKKKMEEALPEPA